MFLAKGFSDVSNACCGGGTLGGLKQCGREGYKICNNPNEFMFWDFYHPTERTYHLMSKALWNGMPLVFVRLSATGWVSPPAGSGSILSIRLFSQWALPSSSI